MTNHQPGTIILLNGTGSAGKTSIARALQQQCAEPLLHLGMDNYYLEVCPPQFLFRLLEPGETLANPTAAPESVVFFSPTPDRRETGTAIVVPPFGRRLLASMHHAVAAAARLGSHVVVDHVLWVPAWLHECLALWHDLPVYFVGVHCPVSELEAREWARGDRSAKGVVRWQFARVHRHGDLDLPYDLTVDTSLERPDACAARILQHWRTHPPTAFAQLRELLV